MKRKRKREQKKFIKICVFIKQKSKKRGCEKAPLLLIFQKKIKNTLTHTPVITTITTTKRPKVGKY